ncbi:MAG: 4-(cytidine 5'-diphospho)-2-C-methyl-D-erythritol kinase [Acidobacteria bacterium]|nr:4-(cytidine 5'-diphospho)-2-C-methyl-D-erythritol kinase [Acidobacteriota bacterium]
MIAVPSFAKINLYLRVLEREASGYHRIETIFQTISLHDTLVFQPLADSRLAVVSDVAPQGEANIVYQAAARVLPKGKGIHIAVRKRIPMGAGLGGGSSNAAVTLLVVNSLFGRNHSLSQLAAIAGELGADVPCFLIGGTALGQHYGEQVVPLPDAPASSLLLLYPGVAVSTAEAYANLTLTKGEPDGTISDFCYSLVNHRVDLLEAAMRNSFERSACRNRQIAAARSFLRRQGFSRVHLSGSGSTLFVLGDRQAKLPPANGWEVFRTRFLSRGRYRKTLARYLRWPEH